MKFRSFCALALMSAFFTQTHLSAQGKARIIIKTDKNGIESEQIREITIDSTQDLNDIFLNLGLLNDFGFLQEGQEFEINIDQFNRMGEDHNLQFKINPWNDSATGAEKQAFLGIRMKEETVKTGKKEKQQVIITEVTPGSAAARCGLLSGDVLLEIDKNNIQSTEQVMLYISSKAPGDKIKLEVKRNGKTIRLNAVLGAKPNVGNRKSDSRHPTPKNRKLNKSQDDKNALRHQQELEGTDQWMKDMMPDMDNMLEWNDLGMPQKQVAYLGVSPALNPSSSGAEIVVNQGTAAEQLGLMDGDIISELNGEKIPDFSTLANKIRTMQPNEEIALKVIRNGEEKALTGKLGSRELNANSDFRIYRDYKGMDEGGDHLFNYEFDMDAMDLERHMEDLLRQLDDRQLLLEEQRWKLEGDLDRYRNGKNSMKVKISIIELEPTDKKMLSEKSSTKESLDNVLVFDEISFYPNPNVGLINLKFKTSDQSDIKIVMYDSEGSIIYLEERSDFTGDYNRMIDLTGQPNGSYILQIIQGNKSYLKKIVKAD